MERKKCRAENCNNLAVFKETKNGKKRYSTLCTTHKRRRNKPYLNTNNPCIICGWSGKCEILPDNILGYTHRHRIIPGEFGGEYTEDNVVSLCPNCHQAVHNFIRASAKGNKKVEKSICLGLYESMKS